ncbi:MAG: septum formation initiator family protein [Hyphomicrobiaceae bacterium]
MWRRSPVLLACLCLTAYFGFHAVKGRHGLEARAALVLRFNKLKAEQASLEAVRDRLDNEVHLLAEHGPDPDYVDELARSLFRYASPKDVVILHPSHVPTATNR